MTVDRWHRGCFFAPILILGCGFASEPSQQDLKKMAGGELKEMVHVSGTVTVDGTPAEGVNIYLHPSAGGKPVRECRTSAKGKYCWTTYVNCDGLEPGDYKLTFKYLPQVDKKGRGEDLLKGKYSNPAKTTFALKVARDEPQKDADYDLEEK